MRSDLLLVNLLVSAGLLVGAVVERITGFAVVQNVFGLAAFILLGFNLATLARFKSIVSSDTNENIIFVPLFSVLAVTVLGALARLAHLDKPYVLIAAVVTVNLAVAFFLLRLDKQKARTKKIDWPNMARHTVEFIAVHRTVLWLLVGFGVLMSLHFLTYRFIPEADSYRQLMAVSQYQASSSLPDPSRSFLLILTSAINYLTAISPYALFKFVFPLLGFSYIATAFLLSPLLKHKFSLGWCALLAISAPVVIEELLVTRPQTLVMVFFPITLYLLYTALKRRSSNYLFIALALSLTLLLSHETAWLLVITGAVTLLVFYREWIKSRWLPFTFWAILALLAVTLFAPPRILAKLLSRFIEAKNALAAHGVDWWFIGSYTNVDQNRVGWPGISALYYYAYNLGLALPVLSVVLLAKRRVLERLDIAYAPYVISGGLAFAIAEILPRFRVYFLPDRVWPFMVASLAPILVYYCIRLEWKGWLRRLVIISVTVSLAASLGLSALKQGRVSKSEYQAASWLANNSGQSSLVVSQSGNGVFIRYFAERKLVSSDRRFFYDQDSQEIRALIGKIRPVSYNRAELEHQRLAIHKKMRSALNEYELAEDPVVAERFYLRLADLKRGIDRLGMLIEQTKRPLSSVPDVYSLYSLDKFNTIYRYRAWWMDQNFYLAETEWFDTHPELFSQVYDNGQVRIWKYKK